MRELEGLLRPQRPQRLDDAEADAAATVHRNARRLVEHQQPLVLVHDGAPELLAERRSRARRLPGRGHAHRRDTDAVPELHAQLRVGTATVDAHLALADEAKQPAARHSRQLALQTIVQALAGLVLADLVVLHAGARFARLGRGRGVLGVRHCFYNDPEYTL